MGSSDSLYATLDSLLQALEQAMRGAGQWQDAAPDAAAFQSVEPFCFDTMSLSQWLQFVLLVRFRQLLEARQALPTNCAVAPVAEEYYGAHADAADIIETLRRIDALLTAPR